MNTQIIFNRKKGRAGFSAVELLVVVAVVAVVAVLVMMFLPRKAQEKDRSREVVCLNNLRLLSAGWGNYPLDNQDRLMPNPGWVSGRMGWRQGAGRPVYFDPQRLMDPRRSLMAEYVKKPEVYHCPADTYKLPEYTNYRIRSVSMNGVLVGSSGSGASVRGFNPGGKKYFGKDLPEDNRPARMLADLEKPGPSQVFVILDEHPDSIEDATFMFDPGYVRGAEWWRDLPGSSHDGAAGIVFADGHAEMHTWVETNAASRTVYPVTMTGGSPWQAHSVGSSKDYEWLEERMPFR